MILLILWLGTYMSSLFRHMKIMLDKLTHQNLSSVWNMKAHTLFQKILIYGRVWSISLGHFSKHKPLYFWGVCFKIEYTLITFRNITTMYLLSSTKYLKNKSKQHKNRNLNVPWIFYEIHTHIIRQKGVLFGIFNLEIEKHYCIAFP